MLDAKHPYPASPESPAADRHQGGGRQGVPDVASQPPRRDSRLERWTTRRLLTVPGLSHARS